MSRFSMAISGNAETCSLGCSPAWHSLSDANAKTRKPLVVAAIGFEVSAFSRIRVLAIPASGFAASATEGGGS